MAYIKKRKEKAKRYYKFHKIQKNNNILNSFTAQSTSVVLFFYLFWSFIL